MSIRIAYPDDRLLVYRPKCIVSHVDSPLYESYAASRFSYAQLTSRIGGRNGGSGLWILKDVHIVDHHVAEVMAWLKHIWPLGKIDLVLVAPEPEPARRWARYIGDPRPRLQRIPVLPLPRRRPMVVNVTQLDAVALANWLHQQELEGDVLVFAASAAQRDQLVQSLRVCCLQPVYVIHERVPFAARKSPRVLVGGPGLDYLLSSDTVERVQHVVDYGTIYRVRQDTGNDWEITAITKAMALRRRRVAGNKAAGVCLCVYESDTALSDEPFATHLLRPDLCHAKLLVKYGTRALEGFPIDLNQKTGRIPRPVAEIMARLNVERPVAEIIRNSPSIEAGIAIAAIVARHVGPFPGNQYEAFRNGATFADVMASIHKWAALLQTSRQQVLKELRLTPWQTALPIVSHAYRGTAAIHAGARNLFIDASTGDILHCRFSHRDIAKIVYTHRHKNEILAYVILPPNAPDDDLAAVALASRSVPLPMPLRNPLETAAMKAWFEKKRVVVAHTSNTDVRLTFAPQVPINDILSEWLTTMRTKALDKPLAMPIGDDMHILFTAGLRFADAVKGSDFAIVQCDAKGMEQDELYRLHELPASFLGTDTPTAFLLPKRDMVQDMLHNMSNITLQGAATKLSKHVPADVSVELVVRTYLSKSTGRVAIRGPSREWIQHIQPSWGWTVVIATEERVKIHNVPRHMDEFDIAELLQINATRITVDRATNVITQLVCVADFLEKLPGPVDTFRTLRVNDAVVRLDEKLLGGALQLLYADLPTHNDIVNQPIRAFWRVTTLEGSRPPKHARPSKMHILIRRDSADAEMELLRFAIANAREEAESITPEVVWWPQLAGPGVHCDLPNAEQEGAKFRIYGSKRAKEAAKRKLAMLASQTLPATSLDTCKICFDREAFYRLQVCGCRICLPCLAATFETKCFDASFVGELLCPFCNERVATDDIAAAVSEPALHAYALKVARFFSSRIPDVILECPARCGFFGRSQQGDASLDCRRCRERWCTRCSDKFGELKKAHKGYCDKLWDTAFWNEFADEARRAGAKPCPTCGAFVAKDGGCSHVTCSAPLCQTHFCWKCTQAFSHHQNSPLAQGTVVDIDDALVTVAVTPDTWGTPCMTPCPSMVHVKRDFFPDLLLEHEILEKGAKVWVFSYIYDHIDACAVPSLV